MRRNGGDLRQQSSGKHSRNRGGGVESRTVATPGELPTPGEIKSASEEPRGGRGRPGSSVGDTHLRRQQPGENFSPERKRCARCGEWKPPEGFSPNPRMRNGLDSWCKECRNEYTRQWRADHPERARELSRAAKRLCLRGRYRALRSIARVKRSRAPNQ